jgi:hypothetical protein
MKNLLSLNDKLKHSTLLEKENKFSFENNEKTFLIENFTTPKPSFEEACNTVVDKLVTVLVDSLKIRPKANNEIAANELPTK